ncbi:MAG: 3-dehydroquinate synthase [Candidatus Hermodarchaeota archaeon]
MTADKKTSFVEKPRSIYFKSKSLGSYNIIIQRGVFQHISKNLNIGNRYLIITDSNLRKLYADDLKRSLEKEGKESSVISFPAGEQNKTLKTFSDLHEKINLSLDRKSCIIALGGGVCGDMAGFVASTYMRGIPFVQIPTSLIAMVDSSIGGKLGINTSKGKNCVGVFNNPQKVYIDPLILKTLPEIEIKNGLAEVLKHAIIKNQAYFKFIVNNVDRILSLNSEVLARLLYDSIKIKMSFVREDEKEAGKRRILNFGHTVGHALEEVLGYGTISHGFAVSIGMVAASNISLSRGMVDEEIFSSIRSALALLGLPVSLKDLNLRVELEKVYRYIKHDKKTISGKTDFILIKGIGKPVIKNDITYLEITEAIEYVS